MRPKRDCSPARRASRCVGAAAVCILLAFASGVSTAAAQDAQARVSGTVVDATTGQPLANVAVQIRGTSMGTVTDAAGRYELAPRLPSGSYTLEFSMLGRESVSQALDIAAGESVQAEAVALRETAIQLEGIVVTGAGVATQRRALGNAVSVVGGDAIANARATSVDAALQGKVPGAQIMSNNGQPGGGTSVRLRGTSSIIGGAEPLYIVDGVIVDNSSSQQINFGYRTNPTNRLADINPNDIERVEVLKGAAAAALYGSRANNGVIQIFTKRGAAGGTQITASTRATLAQRDRSLPFALTPIDGDSSITRYDHQDLVFRDAWGNESTVSVSGGADQTRFYLSGTYTKDNGIMIGSSNERISGRLNVDQTVGDWLTLSGGANYVRNDGQLLINGENGTGGVLTAIVFTGTDVDLAAKDPETGQYAIRQTTFPNPLEVVDAWNAPQTTNRFVGSFQARATPRGGPSLEYRLGYDTYNMETGLFIPRGTPARPTGSSTAVTRTQFLVNNDVVASYSFGAGPRLALTSTAGMNHTYSREQTVSASAEDLVPATELVRGAVQFSSQSRFETATLGFFAQQQLALDDRLFLTGALRWDASSTFGSDERWQLYPKLSGSYVISDAAWWRESGIGGAIDNLRLRGALGFAGNQPPVGSAYARFPRYGQAININRSGLVHLSNPGNPNLKPERQREYELGFDAGLFGDRVGLGVTYYDQYVKDLLLSRTFAPSTGYASVLDNVGELSNKGIELQLDTRNIDRPDFGWSTTFNFSLNRNRVERLAGAPFTEGYNNRVQEGDALGVWRLVDFVYDSDGRVSVDGDGLPVVDTNNPTIVGDPNPDFQASLRNEIRLGRHLTASVLLDGVFGHDVWNQTVRIMDLFLAGPMYDKQLRGDNITVGGRDFLVTSGFRTRYAQATAAYLEDGTFVKLREVSLVYAVPAPLVERLGLGSLSLELAGRNLFSITDYTGYDPETNMFGTSTVARGTDFATYPNPRTFSFGVRAGF